MDRTGGLKSHVVRLFPSKVVVLAPDYQELKPETQTGLAPPPSASLEIHLALSQVQCDSDVLLVPRCFGFSVSFRS